MSRIKKILAPTDFSELSKLGVRYALDLADETRAEVLVYHAIDFGDEWTDRQREIAAHPDVLEHSRKTLDSFITANFADSLKSIEVRRAVEIGAATQSIAEKAADEGADMIVMSTHGRSGIEHIILGSVAEKVVARAPCPVLVVPRRSANAIKPGAA